MSVNEGKAFSSLSVGGNQRDPDVLLTDHVSTASGGNAGLAAACAAKALQVKCTIYLPEWVNESLLSVFAEEGAQVVVGGKIYADALQAAQQAVDSNADA